MSHRLEDLSPRPIKLTGRTQPGPKLTGQTRPAALPAKEGFKYNLAVNAAIAAPVGVIMIPIVAIVDSPHNHNPVFWAAGVLAVLFCIAWYLVERRLERLNIKASFSPWLTAPAMLIPALIMMVLTTDPPKKCAHWYTWNCTGQSYTRPAQHVGH